MSKKLNVFFLIIVASAHLSGSSSWQTIYNALSNNKRILAAAGLVGASLIQKDSTEMKYMGIYGGLLQAFSKIAPAYQKSTNQIFDFTASIYASYKIINALQIMPKEEKKEEITQETFESKSYIYKTLCDMETKLSPLQKVMQTIGAFSAGYLLYKKSPIMLQKASQVMFLGFNLAALHYGPSFWFQTAGLCSLFAQGLHYAKVTENKNLLMCSSVITHWFINCFDTSHIPQKKEKNKLADDIINLVKFYVTPKQNTGTFDVIDIPNLEEKLKDEKNNIPKTSSVTQKQETISLSDDEVRLSVKNKLKNIIPQNFLNFVNQHKNEVDVVFSEKTISENIDSLLDSLSVETLRILNEKIDFKNENLLENLRKIISVENPLMHFLIQDLLKNKVRVFSKMPLFVQKYITSQIITKGSIIVQLSLNNATKKLLKEECSSLFKNRVLIIDPDFKISDYVNVSNEEEMRSAMVYIMNETKTDVNNYLLLPNLNYYCNYLTYSALIASGAYGLRTLAKHIA